MQAHNAALAGAIGSAGVTIGDAMAGSNWQTIAANALIALITAGISAYLKSRSNAALPDATTKLKGK